MEAVLRRPARKGNEAYSEDGMFRGYLREKEGNDAKGSR